MQKMQLSPELRQWASCVFEELQHPCNLLQMRTSPRARPLLNVQTSHRWWPQLSRKQTVSKGEYKCYESQSVAAPKPMAKVLFICSVLTSQRQKHLKKIVLRVVALTNTSKKAWPLTAAVISVDAHRTDSLAPVRFELGPRPLPHWAQPWVPTAIRLPTYTKPSGSSSPVASTHAAGWIEKDPSNTTCQAGDTHRGAGTNNAPTWAALP